MTCFASNSRFCPGPYKALFAILVTFFVVTSRPIVSAIDGPTDKLSRFVDNIIRPLVPSLPSYIKDTTDMLIKLRDLGHIPSTAILCTMDVSALYTNIPQQEGVASCLKAIQHPPKGVLTPHPPLEIVSFLMKTILERNCFQFNGRFYLQTTGTAMGTAMAPSYANLFMGELERKLLMSSQYQPHAWYRFIDDIFFVWTNTAEALEAFTTHCNNHHPTIKFTKECSVDKVPFLDLEIKLENNRLTTRTYHKPTDAHNYLHFKSNHPGHQKKGRPYAQFLRMVRNCIHVKDI